MKKSDLTDYNFVEHALDAIKKIESYLDGVDFETYCANDMLFDAVVREIEIIGEASNNISVEFQKKHPDIPWHKVISMRNTLIHEYFGVDKELVWNTCLENLPELKNIFSKILKFRD